MIRSVEGRTSVIGDAYQELYAVLWERFGPQHWWPARDAEEVVIGAVLTQAVAWRNVEQAMDALRGNGLCSLERIASADRGRLAELIRPCRYFNVKAAKLQAVATYICSAGGLAALRERRAEDNRQGFLGVYGIGPETADAILCYALHQAAMVADAYSRRVLGRIGLLPEAYATSYSAAHFYLTPRLPSDPVWLGEFHALLVAVGKDACTLRHPVCGRCPAQSSCAWAHSHGPSGQDSR